MRRTFVILMAAESFGLEDFEKSFGASRQNASLHDFSKKQLQRVAPLLYSASRFLSAGQAGFDSQQNI
jgi:hypothetical protein